MPLSNQSDDWSFAATPRELQFLVTGIAVGTLAVAVELAAGMILPACVFGTVVPAAAAFVVLGIVRTENNRKY